MSSPLCCACRRLYVKTSPRTLFPLPSALRAMRRAPPLSSIVVVASIRVPSPLLRASPPGLLEAGLRGQRWPSLHPASACLGNVARQGHVVVLLRRRSSCWRFERLQGKCRSRFVASCARKNKLSFSSLCRVEGHFGGCGGVCGCFFFFFNHLTNTLSIVLLS